MTLFDIALFLTAVPAAHLCLLALGALRDQSTPPSRHPRSHFAVFIPAHNEEAVIFESVSAMRKADYPADLFDVHVIADHCTDRTAERAREAGAIVHLRETGPAGSKGAAVIWGLSQALQVPIGTRGYDAVVLFDADTRMSPEFLRVMDARLASGALVIQGQHRISNPNAGWFAALTWAMFLIDNRFQNLGRANLGLSAKDMGDSICFRSDVLRQVGIGEGLTEDYAFRQSLLLAGIRIQYEPGALGFGEAAPSLRIARLQRLRWLRGTFDANRRNAWTMLRQGIRRRDAALLDGAMQGLMPSFSTLTMVAMAILACDAALALKTGSAVRVESIILVAFLFFYPFLGLLLERAPLKAYLAISLGPFFVIWRTWLAIVAMCGTDRVVWVRTEHGKSL